MYMKRDMKRNIQMRNMKFTERKQHTYASSTYVQPDLALWSLATEGTQESGCKEYKDLKSDRRIANADIRSGRIANPLEQGIFAADGCLNCFFYS